ncbi:chorismate mutase, partial [Ascobolus immersus RN42]
RLEDTIIFHLIERVQFPFNETMYTPGGVSIPNFKGSFLEWMLREQEQVFAKVRRYQSPDEYPFFPDSLPEPFLAPLKYPQLLHPNNVNINRKLLSCYISHILPSACNPPNATDAEHRGEQYENFGSAAVEDVAVLQSLSRRIHFGKFVAEAKFRQETEKFTKLIKERDVKGLDAAITNEKVELQVLKRLEEKAKTFGIDPSLNPGSPLKVNVDAIVEMYKKFVIPLTKEVEVDYLLMRLDEPTVENGMNGTVNGKK